MLEGLSFIHSKSLFHRDIKPENCMLQKDTLCLKLVDFGSTRDFFSEKPYTEYVSTRWYRAPECLLTGGFYGPEVDIWAVGCMLYELVTGTPLFPGSQEIDQIKKIHKIIGTPSEDLIKQFRKNPNENISYVFKPCKPVSFSTLLPNSSPAFLSLLAKLLVYNPENRISAKEALLHPVFDFIREAKSYYVAENTKIPFWKFALDPKPPKAQKIQFPFSLGPGRLILVPPTGRTVKSMAEKLAPTRKLAAIRIKDYQKKNNTNKSYKFSHNNYPALLFVPKLNQRNHFY